MSYYRSTDKAMAETETGMKTQREMKQRVAGTLHECENCDKCSPFLSRTSYVADCALSQVHVTVRETNRERKGERGRATVPEGERKE